MKRESLLSVFTLLALACSPSGDDAPADANASSATIDQPEAYCAPLYPHLAEACATALGSFGAQAFAAATRETCRGFPIASERDCLLAIQECTEASLLDCNVPQRIFSCQSDAECMGGLVCDTQVEECAECLDRSHCAPAEVCFSGLCLPEADVPEGLEVD